MSEVEWSPELRDRAVGAVLASALGDAMGAPYEFGLPRPDAPCRLEGGGAFDWEPGEWTDDTQMALAIVGALGTRAVGTSADPRVIEALMKAWFEGEPRDVGNQTRAVLGAAVHSGESLSVAAAEYQERNPDAAGNGALMRTGPVALAYPGDRAAVAALAASVAALTHPHPDSVDACVLWSLAIERALRSAADDPFDWVDAVTAGLEFLDKERRGLWSHRIDDAAGANPVAWTANNGWVVAAFQAALAAVTSTPVPDDHPSDHLVRSLKVACKSGGDTDTVAAIAGALLGSRWGAGAVPKEWLARLHGRRTYDRPALSGDELAREATRALGIVPPLREWDEVEPYGDYLERLSAWRVARGHDSLEESAAAQLGREATEEEIGIMLLNGFV